MHLIPNEGIVRVFPKEDQSVNVWFKKTAVGDSNVTFSCLHQMGLSSNANKQQKICWSYKIFLDFDVKKKILGGWWCQYYYSSCTWAATFPQSFNDVPFLPTIWSKKLHHFFQKKTDESTVETTVDFSESQANTSSIHISVNHEGQVKNGQVVTDIAREVDGNSPLVVLQVQQLHLRQPFIGV